MNSVVKEAFRTRTLRLIEDVVKSRAWTVRLEVRGTLMTVVGKVKTEMYLRVYLLLVICPVLLRFDFFSVTSPRGLLWL